MSIISVLSRRRTNIILVLPIHLNANAKSAGRRKSARYAQNDESKSFSCYHNDFLCFVTGGPYFGLFVVDRSAGVLQASK